MSDSYVVLTRATHPVQKSLIEQILQAEGIPFNCLDNSLSVIFGGGLLMGYQEFQVPSERLQEAKDALCAGGVVCEVSHRLLNRTLEKVIEPLLQSEERDYERLTHLVEINNKETVHALFDRTLELEGGRELLEDLFFELARESCPGLLSLARSLAGGATSEFLQRCAHEANSGDKESRMALLEVLREIPSDYLHRKVMAVALTDADFDIRDAASEVLYSLTESSCGYDPEDPPEKRFAAVEKILGRPLQPGSGTGSFFYRDSS